MPYGLPKDVGGDSPANEKWMHGCIAKVEKGKVSHTSAILICKRQLINTRRKNSEVSLEDTIAEVTMHRIKYIESKLKEGKTFTEAVVSYQNKIKDNNYQLF